MGLFKRVWHDWLKRPYRLSKIIDTGTGKTVLLVHGLGTNSHTWTPLLKHVDQTEFRLLAFDLLGFGESPKPDNKNYTVSDHAKSIYASLSFAERNDKVIVIAHSMGCLVASHLAWMYPDMISRMILYEPPLFADSPEFRTHSKRRELYFNAYKEILKRPRLIFSYSKLSARFGSGRTLSVNPQSWVAFERSLKNTIMEQKAYDELKATKVRTDIVYGKFDFIVTRTDVKDMLKANPNVTFHLVNEMHDVTDRAARFIVRLLEGKPATKKRSVRKKKRA